MNCVISQLWTCMQLTVHVHSCHRRKVISHSGYVLSLGKWKDRHTKLNFTDSNNNRWP